MHCIALHLALQLLQRVTLRQEQEAELKMGHSQCSTSAHLTHPLASPSAACTQLSTSLSQEGALFLSFHCSLTSGKHAAARIRKACRRPAFRLQDQVVSQQRHICCPTLCSLQEVKRSGGHTRHCECSIQRRMLPLEMPLQASRRHLGH